MPPEYWDPRKDSDYNPEGWDPNKDEDYNPEWSPGHYSNEDCYKETRDHPEQNPIEHIISSRVEANRFAIYFRSSMDRLSDLALEIEYSDLPLHFKTQAERNREFISDCLEAFRTYLDSIWIPNKENPYIFDNYVGILSDMESEVFSLREEVAEYEGRIQSK